MKQKLSEVLATNIPDRPSIKPLNSGSALVYDLYVARPSKDELAGIRDMYGTKNCYACYVALKNEYDRIQTFDCNNFNDALPEYFKNISKTDLDVINAWVIKHLSYDCEGFISTDDPQVRSMMDIVYLLKKCPGVRTVYEINFHGKIINTY